MPTSPEVKLATVKTLVALHGQRAAARIAGLSEDTVKTWKRRYNWPSSTDRKPRRKEFEQTLQKVRTHIEPNEIVMGELESNKRRSKIALSRFLADTSEEAAAHEKRLEITQEAKHLSEIHKNIYPEQQSERNILSLNVLIGGYKPLDSDPNA